MGATEQWRPVPGWEGYYEVSDLGRVASRERRTWHSGSQWGHGFWRTVGARVLKSSIARGYERVVLQRDRTKQDEAVHRLVMLAFVGPCPDGMEVCHNDGDKRNNALRNLRYDTRSANHLDRTRHGKNHNALKTHCPQGHAYSPENTRMDGGSRKCKACRSRKASERKKRNRAAARKAAA